MSQLLADFDTVLEAARSALVAAEDPQQVDAIRVQYLGRKGKVTALLKGLRELPAAERPAAGQRANQLKTTIQEAIDARLAELEQATSTATGPRFDFSLPGRRRPLGRQHPLTLVLDDCLEIFRRLGFVVAEGPDIETEYYNFDALNTPADHPARDPQDTFYFGDGRLLRTQTSPVQVRVMERQDPPVRIVAPGRCYRRDTPDATHSMNFHQIEGLYVDRGVSLADLKGLLVHFARELFGPEKEIRLRPHFFPFTEPSIEWDVAVDQPGEARRWMEIAGAGMVDPNVLRNVGYDPEVYTGYAFGLGIERMAMIKYRITDIRLLYENDLRILEQF